MNIASTRIAVLATTIVVAAVALSACSTGTAPSSSNSPASTAGKGGIVRADVTIGVGGQLSNADVYTAISDGYFGKQGLTAKTTTLTAGANAVPQLLNGGLTFATVDTTTAINATQQNLGITTIATNTVGVPGKVGYGMVVANPKAGITRPKDLEGKKVQVNQIGGTAQVLTEASVKKDGGDPSKVQFVEIAPPQAIPALQAGQVDAAVVGEPNVTAAKALGFDAVFNPEQNTVPNLPTFVFVTSKAYATAHPQIVAQFQAAILAAHKFDNANPDAVRAIAKANTTVPAAIIDKVARLPLFGEAPITGAQIQSYIDLLVKYGALKKGATPRGSAVIWTAK